MTLFNHTNIDQAYELINTCIIKTPLVSNDYINQITGGNILFKLENLQITGSFKFRGASNKIAKLTKEFGKKENDTGSTETQIAVLTERIKNITSHLQDNKKDNSGRRGLVILVSKRRKLLNYLRRINVNSYRSLLEKLNIRK